MCWNRKRFCSCNKLCMLKLPFLFQNSLFTGYFQKHYEVPGLVFFKGPFWGAYFWRGVSSEGFIYCMKGNLPFKIDWASLIDCFWFVLLYIWGHFSKYKPPEGLYLEGRFNGRFFVLLVWGAYIWRGLFSEF